MRYSQWVPFFFYSFWWDPSITCSRWNCSQYLHWLHDRALEPSYHCIMTKTTRCVDLLIDVERIWIINLHALLVRSHFTLVCSANRMWIHDVFIGHSTYHECDIEDPWEETSVWILYFHYPRDSSQRLRLPEESSYIVANDRISKRCSLKLILTKREPDGGIKKWQLKGPWIWSCCTTTHQHSYLHIFKV